MIRLAERKTLTAIQSADPFCTRILSLYESYGEGYDFIGFWEQEIDGEITAAIARFEEKFSLYLTDGADVEELAAFLRFQGAGSVMLDERFALPLSAGRSLRGQVLAYRGENYISELEIYQPEIKPLYALLKSCESEHFIVPAYLPFLSDVRHRLNRGKCQIVGTDVESVLASALMTVSETAYAAILGAVATRPDYRRRGLSRELVRTLASRITKQGREAFVFSASESNTRFYENSGFEVVAEFRELINLM